MCAAAHTRPDARTWLGVRMDGIDEWTRAQQRVIELVSDRPAEQTEVVVPACPDWSARDLLSHMVGLGADVTAGDEPDDHNSTWTARQVQQRRDRTVAQLVTEWESLTDPLREWMRDNGTRPLGDVVIHEQDLRGALRAPGGQDSAGLRSIRDVFLGRLAKSVGDLPPIALVDESWSWVSAGSVDDAAVLLRAPAFDLARAVLSRRSKAQLRAWTERGDVTPYLPAFAQLGALPEQDLTESRTG